MPALINFKICDNSKECPAMEVCPTNAIYWYEPDKKLKIDNSKCNNCRLCEIECTVDAIRVAEDYTELQIIKKEIEDDPRIVSDLFVDRYGAMPIHPAFQMPQSKFKVSILESGKTAALEIFKEESIECLLYSIPLKELLDGIDIKYRKMEVEDNSILDTYDVKKLPSLLFFKDGRLLGKIEGFCEKNQKAEIKNKIHKILNPI